MKRYLCSIVLALLLVLSNTAGVMRLAFADTIDYPSVTAPIILDDKDGTINLSIQLQSGLGDTGQVDFSVPGIGDYTGIVVPNQTGPHNVHLHGNVAVDFAPVDGSDTTPTTLKVEGVIDTSDLSANINVWINGTHYHLQTAQGNVDQATTVAQQAIAALQAEDWGTLYVLLAPDSRGTQTQADFVQEMTTTASQGPTLVSVAAIAAGQVKQSPYGYTYYQQPLSIQVRQGNGGTTTYQSNLTLLLEQGQWYYVTTDPPPAS